MVPGFEDVIGHNSVKNKFVKMLSDSTSPSVVSVAAKSNDNSNLLPNGRIKSFTKEMIESFIEGVRNKMVNAGVDVSKNPDFVNMDKNPAYKEAFTKMMQNKFNDALTQLRIDKAKTMNDLAK